MKKWKKSSFSVTVLGTLLISGLVLPAHSVATSEAVTPETEATSADEQTTEDSATLSPTTNDTSVATEEVDSVSAFSTETASAAVRTVNSFAELAAAITDFNNGQAIQKILLAAPISVSAPLQITNTAPINIAGSGAATTLSRTADFSGSFFAITTGNVSFDNLVIDGQQMPSSDSLVTITNGSLTLNSGTAIKNGVISETDNPGSFYEGGAITATDSNIVINDGAELSSNHAANGGAITFVSSSAITNLNNIMSGGTVTPDANTLTINGGTFSNNQADASGGVIYSFSFGQLAINGGMFTNNTAGYEGGVLFTADANRQSSLQESPYEAILTTGYSTVSIGSNAVFTDNSAAKEVGKTYTPAEIAEVLHFDAQLLNNDVINYVRSENVWSVAFETNGASQAIGNEASLPANNYLVAQPSNPQKSGYTFAGWYADAAFQTAFDFSTPVTADTTVYAKWTKNSTTNPTTPTVNKSQLQALVNQGNQKDLSGYTSASVTNLQNELKNAQALLNSSAATQAQINAEVQKLQAALDALVLNQAGNIQALPLYRLYNPNSGEHLYTLDAGERNNLIDIGWNYEGLGWSTPSAGQEVLRLYNPNSGEHLYTVDLTEFNILATLGWVKEGHAFYSATTKDVPIYRLYNENETTFNHHYTKGVTERDWLVGLGWEYEGIAFYGVK